MKGASSLQVRIPLNSCRFGWRQPGRSVEATKWTEAFWCHRATAEEHAEQAVQSGGLVPAVQPQDHEQGRSATEAMVRLDAPAPAEAIRVKPKDGRSVEVLKLAAAWYRQQLQGERELRWMRIRNGRGSMKSKRHIDPIRGFGLTTGSFRRSG